MDDKPERVVPVLKKIHDSGKGVIGMKIIGEGRYRNDPEKRQASTRYVLNLGCVDVITVGLEKPEEIAELKSNVKKALAEKTQNVV